MIVTRLAYAVLYIMNLAYNMLISAFSTLFACLTGSIDPRVVEVDTQLTKNISHYILANSITLTPGTLTIDIDHENRILKVAVLTPRKAKSIIPFEKYIRGMCE